MNISNVTPVGILTDEDLLVVVQEKGEPNSVSMAVVKNYLNEGFIVAPKNQGTAGQVLTINDAGDTLWMSIGGGGTVTTNYENLTGLPLINSVVLKGNKTSAQLGLAAASHTHTVSQITNFPTLATVATTGSYNDLLNKPQIQEVSFQSILEEGVKIGILKIGNETYTLFAPEGGGGGGETIYYRLQGGNQSSAGGYRSVILQRSTDNVNWSNVNSVSIPTKVSAFTNDANYVVSSSLKAVATTGSYNDLLNKPTIPDAVDVEALYKDGIKIAQVKVGENLIDLFIPETGGGETVFYKLGGENGKEEDGYRTICLLSSPDGNTYSTINKISISNKISSFTNDAGYITASTMPISTVTLGTDPISCFAYGPTKVVTNTQALYWAKPAAGYKFSEWVINNSTTSSNNPLIITVTNNLSLAARFVADTNYYKYVFLTDWQQINVSQTAQLPTYTLTANDESSRVFLYELLKGNIFIEEIEQAATNINALFSDKGVEYESVIYKCAFAKSTYDFADIINGGYLLESFVDSSNIYIIFNSISESGVYTFDLYKYLDDKSEGDAELFGSIYPAPNWIKIGAIDVATKDLGWFLAKATTEELISIDGLRNIAALLGPPTIINTNGK